MGLGSVVRGVIPVIKEVIGGQDGLMDDITIRYWESDGDLAGGGSYSEPVEFQAVVERKQEQVKDFDGQTVMSQHYLGFIEALPPHGGDDRDEPIDPRDLITLSDGSTGPILKTDGLMDQQTSGPYIFEVWLG